MIELILSAIPEPEVRGVGIVFDNGRPKITDEWVRSLSPQERDCVERALAVHGFRLDGFSIKEIDNGNA